MSYDFSKNLWFLSFLTLILCFSASASSPFLNDSGVTAFFQGCFAGVGWFGSDVDSVTWPPTGPSSLTAYLRFCTKVVPTYSIQLEHMQTANPLSCSRCFSAWYWGSLKSSGM
ncbi:hypothetical protein KEM48_006557 [Puccinia striiformis f. sp. tritici PST-130]|nr:hypothetical protein KEM48_006557 [Puccinia striiformis f. sp. tritici PST-130]